jgi:hypothetical protein
MPAKQRRFSIKLRKPGGMAVHTAILEAKIRGMKYYRSTNSCANKWKSDDIKNIVLH